jgi:hypothetical protein
MRKEEAKSGGGGRKGEGQMGRECKFVFDTTVAVKNWPKKGISRLGLVHVIIVVTLSFMPAALRFMCNGLAMPGQWCASTNVSKWLFV